MRSLVITIAAVAASLAACDRDRPAPPPARQPQPPRRIIEPPTTGIVRPLPPHAIRSDGVGPYKVGDKMAALLQQLPSGPRIVRFEIPGIVRTSVIRAEEDTIVIGGETASTVAFVGVIGSEVARTEKSGVHVGSTVDELTSALGPSITDPDRARDPHLIIPSQQRNLRVLVDGDRITAMVVTSEPTPARTLPDACTRPEVPAGKPAFAACLTAAGEVVEVDDDEVIVRSANGESKVASVRIPNLVFAQPLRNLSDNRDEIIAITSVDDPQDHRWSIVGYRLDGTRLQRSLDSEVVYEMSSARTRWIGAELRDVHMALELTAQPDGIEVGGLLTIHSGDKIRDVVVISPTLVGRKIGKSAAGESGATGSASAVPRTDASSANP